MTNADIDTVTCQSCNLPTIRLSDLLPKQGQILESSTGAWTCAIYNQVAFVSELLVRVLPSSEQHLANEFHKWLLNQLLC